MAVRKTITVSITPEQDKFVRDRLKSGRFASFSEVIRAALRLLERVETDDPPLSVQRSVSPSGANFG